MPSRYSPSHDHQDRKLALSFGAIVLLLMFAVSGVAANLFTQLHGKEEDRLSSVIATIFADSISKVSFSGKYHARLFVEEMQARLPELAFISVETREGKILAHSQPDKNDQYRQENEETALRNLSLTSDAMVSADHLRNGQIIKEVVLPYRSGLNNEVAGVVSIGIKMEEVRREQRSTIVRIAILIVILTLMAIGGVLLLSRYFGSAHRTLATQFRGIMAHAPLLISITNREGQLLDWSNQGEQLLGSQSGRPSLRRYLDGKLAAKDVDNLVEINNSIISSGKPIEREMDVMLHGDPCAWHVSKFPIAHDHEGRPTLICTFIHDITKRKQAEKNALEAKEQWERTFDAIDDIVTIHDPEMRIVRANKAAGTMFEVTPAELVGRFCYEVFCAANEPCEGCPELQSQQDQGNHQAIIHHQKLGKTFDVSSFPIFDSNKLSGFVHIAKDITKSLKLEEQLKQSQKMEAIGTLAGGIAHDFNNILTPILGYSEMAMASIAPDNRLAHYLREIHTAAARAKDLVRQILGFSRQGPQEKKPFEPQLVVKEAIKLLRSSLPTTIEFKTEIAEECGTILADPTQFHQIIMNLCTNAYHAMGPQGGTLGVSLKRVSVDEKDNKVASFELVPGDYVQLTVSDTGCGMDHKVMERIFEPYFTTKANDKGTGLGLSVVHGIVKSYHGQISVYSEPGKGSSFHVYLPRMVEQAIPSEAEQPAALPCGSGQILVVDDEEIITGLLQELLKGLGYQVTVSNDSRKALALIEQNPALFDLLITDMTMPHLTGLELAQRTLARKAELPVILCTGFSELINKEQAHAIGIRAYLTKPISVRELALTVHRILGGDEESAS